MNEKVFSKLEMMAPICLAESWDNVGLLLEPEDEIKIEKIILTNDLTIDVLNEVKEKKAQMIISYHPPLFNSFKRLKNDNWKELVVARCIRNNFYVYSPHTALDAVHRGVNDWLLDPFDIETKYPITPHCGKLDEELLRDHNGGHKVIHGAGRYCTLRHPIPISEVIVKMKEHLCLSHLLLARSHKHTNDSLVGSIAVCAGSGGSVLKLDGRRADLWITGEMGHHDLLDATEDVTHATSVLLTAGHSNSERGYLRAVMQPWLSRALESENVEVVVSELDKDPLITV